MNSDSEKISYINSTELTTESEFKDPHLRALFELANTGAISLHPGFKGVISDHLSFYLDEPPFKYRPVWIVDIDKSIEVLEKCKVETPNTEIPTGREQELFERSQKAVKQTVRAFVKNGDIPAVLAVTVGRFLKPANVRITPHDYARFLYFKHSFPTKLEERADLSIGLKYVFGQRNDYREMLWENGVELTDDYLLDLILRDGVSHEYGHAVHAALNLVQWGAYVVKPNEGEKPKSYWQIREDSAQYIYDTIAPDQDLAEILASEPDSDYSRRSSTSSERLGRGFQYLGTKYALQDMGIDSAKAGKIVETFKKRHGTVLEGYKKVIGEIRLHNLNIEIFSNGITDLQVALKKRGRIDLLESIRFGFGARDLGYFYPLNQDQLRSFVKTFWLPNIVVDNQMNQAMDEAGGVTYIFTDE